MVGVIWFVQIVHYPLFAKVGDSVFAEYCIHHARLTTYVVAAPMLVEVFTAVLLLFYKPDWLPVSTVYLLLGLLVVIWLTTTLGSVPSHHQLQKGFNPVVYQVLVNSNWVRTVAWTIKALVLFSVMTRLLGKTASPLNV